MMGMGGGGMMGGMGGGMPPWMSGGMGGRGGGPPPWMSPGIPQRPQAMGFGGLQQGGPMQFGGMRPNMGMGMPQGGPQPNFQSMRPGMPMVGRPQQGQPQGYAQGGMNPQMMASLMGGAMRR